MVLPKSTVHVSRLAGAALKSFTHGYAQTVVAASQSSYASQNTPVAPLASNLLGRLTDKPNRALGQLAHFSTATNSQQVPEQAVKHDTAANESALAQLQELWQKHHKADTKDANSFQLVKHIGWKAPAPNPESQAQQLLETLESDSHRGNGTADLAPATRLKRSYSTSAVENFARAIDDSVAEAFAFERVHESISNQAVISKQHENTRSSGTSSTGLGQSPGRISALESALYQYQTLGQYDKIPAAFEAMLREGIECPSQRAYQALLDSALNLGDQESHKIPRVLDIYADMIRRNVRPDAQTLGLMVDALAQHALRTVDSSRTLSAKSKRLQHTSVFALDRLDLKIAQEDQTLEIALSFIAAAPSDFSLSVHAFEALIKACALRGKILEMTKLYNDMIFSQQTASAIYPAVIAAFGRIGDLASAVVAYDQYRDLAIANNDGTRHLRRIDRDVYVALITAFCTAGRAEKAKKFLTKVDHDEAVSDAARRSKEYILVNALLPQELASQNQSGVHSIINGLSPYFYAQGLEKASIHLADTDMLSESVQAFEAYARTGADLRDAAAAVFAAHLRAKQLTAGDFFFAVLEKTEINLEVAQLATLRALHYMSAGRHVDGLRPLRSMLNAYRDASSSTPHERLMSSERTQEMIDVVATAMMSQTPGTVSTEAAAELLRVMDETSVVLARPLECLLANLDVHAISFMAPADLEIFIRYQAWLILDEAYEDVAGPARFSCMLDVLVKQSILPSVKTENAIERALVNVGSQDLNELWGNYRYPSTSTRASLVDDIGQSQSLHSPESTATAPSSFDESFDPYVSSTDHRGSAAISDLLEKSPARPEVAFREAMNKFKNIRRVGRHPRLFTYGKLIQAAAKAGQLRTAEEILSMARKDMPYLPHHRVVRHGWISLLDLMVAACISVGRRDVAARYHQDLLEIGSAPSANTFGLYITSLKATTKTFDEASEAVKIFLRSRAEGVEPTAFLYNALIGKLGKARRIDDCLFYFAEMRKSGVRPTSVTYGTIVNALCRVSDEKFAEEIFEEMESSPNYKPRPAPYHSLMQFFLTTKRDRSKVLAYYERMRKQGIEPTMHSYKLLIDAHATIEPLDMLAAERVLAEMTAAGMQPDAVHYASLIHAKGCVAHDLEGARALFKEVLAGPQSQVQACVYQAMIESLVASKAIGNAELLLKDMRRRRVELTPYIVNALVHGWAQEKELHQATRAFNSIERHQREPSTYEAMVRAHLACGDHRGAGVVVEEAMGRGYPSAVAAKIADLVGGGRA